MALMLFSGTTFQSPPRSNGNVNSGGKVYFYEPGTSTPKNAYTASDLATPTANPLILDPNGRGTAWLNGAYKIRLFDSDDNLIDEEDNYNKGSSFDITAVTAARTMVGVDDTASFTHSGTYTVSLTQASTLGAGWFTDHYNIGTGVITFARLAAGDTIDGSAANFTLQPGEFVRITVNSGTTGFVTVLTKRDLYATASGTDTYTCTFAPPISALYSGQKLRVRFTNANTSTAPTLNANSIGAKTIKKEGSAALVAGDIPAGHEAELSYNGTDLILLNPMGAGQAKFNAAGTMTAGTVPLARMQRAYAENSTTSSTLTVDVGTVEVGDMVLLAVNGDFTISAAADGAVTYTIGKTGTATITNCGSSTMPRIERSTSSATTGYYFNGTALLKVTVAGTLLVGVTARGATTVTVSANNLRVSALVFNNG